MVLMTEKGTKFTAENKNYIFSIKNAIYLSLGLLNPLPSGTLATFFLTAVLIQHTNEDDIGREKTILMT